MTRDRLRMDATSENQDPRRRDVLALHLLQKVGIRKGALQGVQFRHFNHAQKRLTIFTKGGKVQTVPVVDRPSGTSSSATFSIGARRLTNI
jgi:site-specific recombinase XerC